jgi:uncharacterized protein
MTKPIGPICNLACRYCFYLEKEKLYPGTKDWRMSDAALESYVRQYIEAQDAPVISFAWQGGEPTLLGVEFFRRAVELQKRYCPAGRKVANSMQTNGVLLDDEWCRFLRENEFLVGVSLDGPRQLHDHYRVDKGGKPTFDRVMRGVELLKHHKVEFNTLTVVNRLNSRHPIEVYRFLRKHGSGHMQFIPLVERVGGSETLAGPPSQEPATQNEPVTPWSVEPKQFGEFLCAIFDEWIRHDVGKVFMQLFEVQLGVWMGLPASLCMFAETCGGAMALEHNGDLYACDHYVYPEYKLGNIMDRSINELAYSARQTKFGRDKADALPKYCRQCEVRFACNGECPKHRFMTTPDGEPGLNYLCAGYKRFFRHIDRHMRALGGIIRAGRPASDIMETLTRHEPARNDLCPCGSGKRYKNCCLVQD